MSVLRYALLAQLAHGPATGYELSRKLAAPVRYFWPASHGQVYPQLANLEAAGLVAAVESPGRGPRLNRRYRLTEAGRSELLGWLGSPLAPPVPRDEFALRVYGAVGDPRTLRPLVEQELARHEQTAAGYRESPLLVGEAAPGTPEFQQQAVLRMGLSYAEHRARWCRWYLDELHRAVGPPDPAAAPAPG